MIRAGELARAALRHHPAARSHITPKAKSCARKTDARRPFPNSRRCSRSIATGGRVERSRCVQVADRINRRGNPDRGASRTPEPPRSPDRVEVPSGLGRCICFNRAQTRRSSGSKRGAAPIRNCPWFTAGSPPPMASKARPNALSPSLPRPAGCAAKVVLEHRSPQDHRIDGESAEDPRPVRSHLFRRPAQRRVPEE